MVGKIETMRPLVSVGQQGRYPKVTLQDPSPHGYLLLAVEIDHRPLFGYLWESAAKRQLLVDLKAGAQALIGKGVVETSVFKALVRPPGKGELLKQRPQVQQAAFDVILLIEADTPEYARTLAEGAVFNELANAARQVAHRVEVISATNARRIGPVDHSRDGVFLFNWFYADSQTQNLAVWEYTAGWFEDQTGLDNSTLMLPDPGNSEYTVVNHCRWDHLHEILPSLIFKPSFRSYVLDNFAANDTAAMPILYRLA